MRCAPGLPPPHVEWRTAGGDDFGADTVLLAFVRLPAGRNAFATRGRSGPDGR